MMKEQVKNSPQANIYLKTFVFIFIPLALLLAGVLVSFYYYDVKSEREIVESQAGHTVRLQKLEITQSFKLMKSDILNLSDWHELHEVIEGADPRDYLAEEYLSFSKRKEIYDQVRFLDESGMEVARVNYDDGRPYIVPKEDLQQKRHRYYFNGTFGLGKNEIFVSPFDLSIENGEIEQPLKPIIRLGTPVFDKQGKKRGVVLLNYLGAGLTTDFEERVTFGFMQPMLVNQEGFWLKAPNPENEWGFMYEDKKSYTFGNAFPQAWQIVSREASGHFYTSKGLFVFVTVYPLFDILGEGAADKEVLSDEARQQRLKEYLWKIINYVPMEYLKASKSEIMREFILLYTVLVSLLGFGSWLLAFAAVRRRQAQRRLQELIQMKLDFVSIVSHELRSPLTIINEGIKIVLDGTAGDINGQQRKFLSSAEENIARLNRLTTEVLDFQKGALGKIQFKMEDCSINLIIKSIKDTVQEMAKKKGLSLSLDLKQGLPQVKADKDKIIQVLTNIISNALKFTEKGGIVIATEEIDTGVKISIADSGFGIDRNELPKLFQDFYQASTVREKKASGTGLGLAICKQIINGHKGKIWAESEPGKGATFFFTLPLNQ